MRTVIICLFSIAFLPACQEEDPQERFEQDQQAIVDYLNENNLQADEHESGLYYNIVEPGTSAKPSLSSGVKVYYQGRLLDGTVFDEVTDSGPPATFLLNQLIPGWQIGIPLIGKGGKITLYLPSALGYGTRGSGEDVPPNSVLIFDIELVDFS
jgi:FKBP-type peptidyl-prolyl cis-trans isomerase FkpA